ncbi:transcriptional regulator [Siccirubricoccus sp. KC 17139]|uniref:Transcriptional regulator n=1 Tax=Siccirubricoccus soli TaxID=2899147 RepID=A0ABT1D1S9_9PROT|nr:transcriptional regulator [Siccirubricoccus soli]MCO6415858.1 transcriptional regulator [Siccirubricoccus soli]MCP2681990.1 transcriptional regulator [Siccirubricoccus soli]
MRARIALFEDAPEPKLSSMIVFIDFEASSLGKHGFPIEVGWAAEDGAEEVHLIVPAPGWAEWSPEAESIHRIALDTLMREGTPHDVVAQRMVDILTGHELYASAPSWDGQWLSKLLRAAGLPRHALRLRGSYEIQREAALAALERGGVPVGVRRDLLDGILEPARQAAKAEVPAHRALEDARRELRLWRDVVCQAENVATRWAKR